MDLAESQIERYTHHIVLKDIGGEGQKRLLASRVLIVGLGGLGAPAAMYLAAAGVGTLGLVDNDAVEASNLQRQIIHKTNDIGQKKVQSADREIRAINPDVKTVICGERLDEKNAGVLVAGYDFIIDGTDNFPSKFLINDTCVKSEKAFSHGGVVGFTGQTFTHIPGSMCLRCVFKTPPEPGFVQSCRGSGILGAMAGIIGSIQAAEAIKFILKRGSLISNRLVTIDALNMSLKTVSLAKIGRCHLCRGGTAQSTETLDHSGQGIASGFSCAM